MHPREPLTKKAKMAIYEYAIWKCHGRTYSHPLVRFILEAERMPRQRLYEWLEDHGYRWDTIDWQKE